MGGEKKESAWLSIKKREEKSQKTFSFSFFACKGLVGHVADTPNETLIKCIHLCSLYIAGRVEEEEGRRKKGKRNENKKCFFFHRVSIVLDDGGGEKSKNKKKTKINLWRIFGATFAPPNCNRTE